MGAGAQLKLHQLPYPPPPHTSKAAEGGRPTQRLQGGQPWGPIRPPHKKRSSQYPSTLAKRGARVYGIYAPPPKMCGRRRVFGGGPNPPPPSWPQKKRPGPITHPTPSTAAVWQREVPHVPRRGARIGSKVGPPPAALNKTQPGCPPTPCAKRGWRAVRRVFAVVPPERASAHSETRSLQCHRAARDP